MIRPLSLLRLAALLPLAACAAARAPEVARFREPPVDAAGADIPEGADPDACYGRDVTPAVIETVTEQVLLRPAGRDADGAPAPAVWGSRSHPRIVEERREVFFETPCPDQMTPDFVASLQRALQARGLYAGPITGEADPATRSAIRAFQRSQGLDSSALSIAAAKRLGLVVYDRDEALAGG